MPRGVAAACLLSLLCACGGETSPEPPNPVDGHIVAIFDGELTLVTRDNSSYVFTIADPTVPVEHLREHQREGLPVRITWHREGDRLVATTIADAPVPGPAAPVPGPG